MKRPLTYHQPADCQKSRFLSVKLVSGCKRIVQSVQPIFQAENSFRTKKQAQLKRKDKPLQGQPTTPQQTLAEVEEVKLMLRTIFADLKGSFNFEKPLIEPIICEDEIDQEILQALFEVGSSLLLPRELATKLERSKVSRHQISRRLKRMNKRLEKEFG